MGIGITPLNIGEMSYVAMETIMSLSKQGEIYLMLILIGWRDSKK